VRAYVFCLVAVVLYAGNTLTGRALEDLPASTVAFARFTIALVLLVPLGGREAWRARAVFARNPGPVLLLSVTGVALFNTLIYAALHLTTATNVSVLQTAVPPVTAVVSCLVLREMLARRQWVGVGLSALGAAWVVFGGIGPGGISGRNAGDAVAGVAVISWARYSVAVRRYGHLFPAHGLVLVMTTVSALLVLPLTLWEWTSGGIPDLDDIGTHLWGLVYVGVFPSVIALVAYNRAVSAIGPSHAAAFLSFLPVFTMLGAVIFLGERIGAAHLVGGALVIVGVLLTTSSTRTSREPAVSECRQPADRDPTT
jgi:drug/metabolite transporter (DMT)-like permease